MKISLVSPKEYSEIFPQPFSLFNSVKFSELNRKKCLNVDYLIFQDSKIRLGIILGEKENSFNSPFSATYGGFSYNTQVPLQYYVESCVLLKEFVHSVNKELRITLPPPLYDKSDTAKTQFAFLYAGAKISSVEYNHYFKLKQFSDYENLLDSKTRNKLHHALLSNFSFQKLNSSNPDDILRAYSVIAINHQERGNPLRMSYTDVFNTSHIIPIDFFVLTNQDNVDIAAAIIFHTSKVISQIVYWGDIPQYSHLRPMNFLAYKIFEYYYDSHIKVLDIGISSENGVPNYGLCEFKENIGCYSTTRFSLTL